MDAADILDLLLCQRASSAPNATGTDVIVYAPDGNKAETVTDYAGGGAGAANRIFPGRHLDERG